MESLNEMMQQVAIMALPVLMAITFHEAAHGWAAERLGDDTARLAGRLTLNPLRHLDLVGSLVFFVTQLIGWAKPVPVDTRKLRDPRRGMMWVALAGPLSNICLALAAALFYRLLRWSDPIYEQFTAPALLRSYPALEGLGLFHMTTIPLYWMTIAAIQLNIVLAVFNLLPLPPLDGGRILAGLLPARQADLLSRIEPYGFLLLILFLFSGAVDRLILPVIREAFRLLLH